MKDYKAKFQIVIELFELSRRAFLFKLRRKHPLLSEAEVTRALRDWYQLRPGAEYGDGEGTPGDPTRFNQ